MCKKPILKKSEKKKKFLQGFNCSLDKISLQESTLLALKFLLKKQEEANLQLSPSDFFFLSKRQRQKKMAIKMYFAQACVRKKGKTYLNEKLLLSL